MKLITAIIPAAILGLALAVPAFAQESASSPGQDMNSAGQEMKNAGSATWNAAKDTGNAAEASGKKAVGSVEDTKITASVKRALHGDEMTHDKDIHVSTAQGVVTLKGNVPSQDTSARAEKIAQSAEHVKSVDNQLAVSGSSSSGMR